MNVRSLALVSAFALALPVAVSAQRTGTAAPRQSGHPASQAQTSRTDQAYRIGWERGVRVGEDDGRQNRRFDYASRPEYRNADTGYDRNYGDRERWRTDFRTGFESGYREGYSRYRGTNGSYGQGGYGNGGYGNGGYGNGGYGDTRSTPPPWANGRGRGRGNGNGNGNGNGSWQRNDLAYQNGFTDGYEAGLNDGRDNRRFDPVSESRYRSGDRGYRNTYGTRDQYRFRYRDAFREGYEYGYQESVRYGRNTNSNSRPSWWPW